MKCLSFLAALILLLLLQTITRSTQATFMKIESDKVFFFRSLRSKSDLEIFINSDTQAARGYVYREWAEPHRMVLGSENSSYDLLDCFKSFEHNRDQQALVMTFLRYRDLEQARDEYLYAMNRAWVYVHVPLGKSPVKKYNTNFTPEHVLELIKDWPGRIRWILGFPEEDVDPNEPHTTSGYEIGELQGLHQLLLRSDPLRRTTVALQVEAVHASHTEYFLNGSGTTTRLQDLLIHAPLNLMPDSPLLNIDLLRKIVVNQGRIATLFDMGMTLRENLTKETDSVVAMGQSVTPCLFLICFLCLHCLMQLL